MRSGSSCLLAFGLLTSLASCGGADGTYVLLTLTASDTPPAGIKTIDLELTLDAKMASSSLAEKGGADISLPTDATLQIRNGQGELTITGIARDAAGAELGRGIGTATVTTGKTTKLTVTIAFLARPGDMATTDGPVDLAETDAGGAVLSMDNQPSYDFGAVVTGSMSAPVTLIVTNTGTLPTGPLGAALVGGNDLTQFRVVTDGCVGKTLAAQATCTVTARSEPNAGGMKSATLSVSATPGGSATTTLLATALDPGALTFIPASNDYLGVVQGQTKDFPFTLKNTGGATTGAITFMFGGSHFAQFSIVTGSDNCTGKTLTSMATCTVDLRFSPATPAGVKNATLTANATPGGPAVAMLKGTSVAPAALAISPNTPNPYSMGTVTAGASATQIFTITNTGGQDSSALGTPTLTGNAAYTIMSQTCTGAVLLGGAANGCTITVKLAPTTFGTKATQLGVSATIGGSVSMMITGTGQESFTIMVAKGSNGTGSVTGTGFTCDLANTDCAETYVVTTGPAPTVTLTASPGTGSNFTSWTSCDSINGSMCTMTASASKTVTASFTLQQLNLGVTMTRNGGSTGTVSATVPASPAFSCTSGTCNQLYNYNTLVTLQASAVAPSTFAGWSGEGCAGTGTCSVTMTQARNVTATFNLASSFNLTVTRTLTDSAFGTVASAPAGISCPTTCMASFASGATVALTPTVNAGTAVEWNGCDSVVNDVCNLNMNATRTVAVSFKPYNWVFVTSALYNGNLGGVPNPPDPTVGADKLCNDLATTAGIRGFGETYIAYLSTSTFTAPSRFPMTARGWVNRSGKPFADLVSDITSGKIHYPIRYDETGAAVTLNPSVFTATSSTGTAYSQHCVNWTSSTTGSSCGGDVSGATRGFTDAICSGCAVTWRIYCFGTKYNQPLVYTRAAGRRAFVTKAINLPASTGLVGFDGQCRSEAFNAALCPNLSTCPFKAMVAPSGGTAKGRFTSPDAGMTYVRPDGIPLASSPTRFWSGALDTTLTVHADGAYENSGSEVWTGATSQLASGSVADTCTNWTEIVSSPGGRTGLDFTGDPSFFSYSNGFGCSFSNRRLYCVEDL